LRGGGGGGLRGRGRARWSNGKEKGKAAHLFDPGRGHLPFFSFSRGNHPKKKTAPRGWARKGGGGQCFLISGGRGGGRGFFFFFPGGSLVPRRFSGFSGGGTFGGGPILTTQGGGGGGGGPLGGPHLAGGKVLNKSKKGSTPLEWSPEGFQKWGKKGGGEPTCQAKKKEEKKKSCRGFFFFCPIPSNGGAFRAPGGKRGKGGSEGGERNPLSFSFIDDGVLRS